MFNHLSRMSLASVAPAHRAAVSATQPMKRSQDQPLQVETSHPAPSAHQQGDLFAGRRHGGKVKNIPDVKQQFVNLATETGRLWPTLKETKDLLREMGFKPHGTSFYGPNSLQAHIEKGTDCLDLMHKGQKVKVKIDPSVRFQ
jgi:hypothetical protein